MQAMGLLWDVARTLLLRDILFTETIVCRVRKLSFCDSFTSLLGALSRSPRLICGKR